MLIISDYLKVIVVSNFVCTVRQNLYRMISECCLSVIDDGD